MIDADLVASSVRNIMAQRKTLLTFYALGANIPTVPY
jgi:hypothetical protein